MLGRCMPSFGRNESGFTLIELLSAVVVTTIGVIALVTTLDTSRELITFAEKRETAVHLAEQELERIQSLSYGEIALTAPPGQSSDRNDPAYFVTGPYFRWDQDRKASEAGSGPAPRCAADGSPTAVCERLVVNGEPDAGTAGAVSPAVTTVNERGGNGNVRIELQMQRFLTWVADACTACTAARDYKRVTVAVKVAGNGAQSRLGGGVVKPVVLTTIVSEDKSL